MRRRTFRLVALLLTFYVGASLDYYVGDYFAKSTDCFCMSARCRVAAIAGDPLLALSHPLETLDLLRTARWLD
jgi:hypothetical protein